MVNIVEHNNVSYKFYEEIEANYDLEWVIEKIKAASRSGKVGLFIGRTIDEPLPNQEGILWVSVDCLLTSTEEKLAYQGRLHLLMDFQDSHLFKKIEGIASEVIIDLSTTKGLGEKFVDHCTSFLKKEPESKLIFEASPYIKSFDANIKTPINQYYNLSYPLVQFFEEEYCDDALDNQLFEEYLAQEPFFGDINKVRTSNHPNFVAFQEVLTSFGESLNEEYWEEDFKEHMITSIRKERGMIRNSELALDNAQQSTFEYLQKLFNHVEYVKKEHFPYQYRPGWIKSTQNFYIATSPKLALSKVGDEGEVGAEVRAWRRLF